MSDLDDDFVNRLKRSYQPGRSNVTEATFVAGVEKLVKLRVRRRRQRLVLGLLVLVGLGGSFTESNLFQNGTPTVDGRIGTMSPEVNTSDVDATELEFQSIYLAWRDASRRTSFEEQFIDIYFSSPSEDALSEQWNSELAAISDLIDVTGI